MCSSNDFYSLGCSLQSAITEITDEAQEDTYAGEWQRPLWEKGASTEVEYRADS